jgi:hypothetical protein
MTASTITCPDCSRPFVIPSGVDGGVCCLSYLHADGRVEVATTRAESAMIYRALLNESAASARVAARRHVAAV